MTRPSRLWPALLILLLPLFLALACTLPAPVDPFTPTPPGTPTPTNTPFPTPTPIPSPTPTLVPAQRVAEGDYALFTGDWDAAQALYQAAYAESSDPQVQSAALLGLGRIHLYTGVYPNALDQFRQVIDGYPDSAHRAEASFLLGQTYHLLARYSEAAEAYRQYRALRPGVLDAYTAELAGDDLSAAGDYYGALAEYILALQSDRLPTDFSLELKVAQTYITVGDYTTAQITLDDIYARTGSDYVKAQVDYLKGLVFATLGQVEQAQAAYLDAVTYYPLAYSSYLSLVELVNAGYPVDELQRGVVDYFAGEYGVALAAFDRYLAGTPTDPATAYYYKGMIFLNQGDTPGAIALWDAIIQDYSDHALWDNAWEEKAYAQWAVLGDYPAAQTTLEDFVSAAPAHARAAEFLYDAARIAERDDRLDEAARLWQRIPGEYPTSPDVFRSMFLAGICHYRLANYASAQSVFLQANALATNPGDRAGATFWVAKSHTALGNTAEAQVAYEQTATLDPTGYYSERAQDILAGRAAFTPPEQFDLGNDRLAEQNEAEAWMRSTFSLPAETDFAIPGPLAGDARFTRGEELWHLGLYHLAADQFESLREAVSNDPVHSYRLAVYFTDLGLYRSAILAARQVLTLAGMDDAGTLNAPALFNRIRFGTYYTELVIPLAQDYAFHPLFVWSLVRQESLFEGFISSSAGARGLMQIMPATGDDIAYRMGWPVDYTVDDLYRPAINLQMGLDYLDDQRAYFGGDLMVSLAAYNGGPGNAAIWQGLANGDPDLFVEVIRFDETRRYVMGIYEIFTLYRWMYNRTP
ncbi:MAG: tetratricopeptide repeat protein [Anaerolineales bacterium]|nr:tetratricopeptide repeat protein [Anaerolineales bacterium]